MKIVVYGAGAVGGFFGGMLARYGQEVQFVARGAHLEALRARGIIIDSTLMGRLHIPPVPAAETSAYLERADLILVCVKAYQTEAILDDLEHAVRDTSIIVPMQNGVESDEVLAERFGRHRVATAVVYVGATLEEPGLLSHVARGFEPFLLFERWEEPLFRERFAGSATAALDWPPMAEIAGQVRIYRPEDRVRYQQGVSWATEYAR